MRITDDARFEPEHVVVPRGTVVCWEVDHDAMRCMEHCVTVKRLELLGRPSKWDTSPVRTGPSSSVSPNGSRFDFFPAPRESDAIAAASLWQEGTVMESPPLYAGDRWECLFDRCGVFTFESATYDLTGRITVDPSLPEVVRDDAPALPFAIDDSSQCNVASSASSVCSTDSGATSATAMSDDGVVVVGDGMITAAAAAEDDDVAVTAPRACSPVPVSVIDTGVNDGDVAARSASRSPVAARGRKSGRRGSGTGRPPVPLPGTTTTPSTITIATTIPTTAAPATSLCLPPAIGGDTAVGEAPLSPARSATALLPPKVPRTPVPAPAAAHSPLPSPVSSSTSASLVSAPPSLPPTLTAPPSAPPSAVGSARRGSVSTPAVKPTVLIRGFQFVPTTVRVPLGGSVVWMNSLDSESAHGVEAVNGEFFTPVIRPGASHEVRCDSPIGRSHHEGTTSRLAVCLGGAVCVGVVWACVWVECVFVCLCGCACLCEYLLPGISFLCARFLRLHAFAGRVSLSMGMCCCTAYRRTVHACRALPHPTFTAAVCVPCVPPCSFGHVHRWCSTPARASCQACCATATPCSPS